MSIAATIQRIGSTASVYRPVAGSNADGSPAQSWNTSPVFSGPVLFQGLTADMSAKVYGAASQVRDEAFVAGLPDIRAGDGVVVTAGFRVGKRWRVEDVRALDFSSTNKHLEIGLVETTDTIP